MIEVHVWPRLLAEEDVPFVSYVIDLPNGKITMFSVCVVAEHQSFRNLLEKLPFTSYLFIVAYSF